MWKFKPKGMSIGFSMGKKKKVCRSACLAHYVFYVESKLFEKV